MKVQTFVRRTLGTSLFLAAALAAAPAAAQDSGPYVSVGGGLAHRMKAGESATTYTLFGNGWGVNVAAGAQMKSGLAVEGEYSHFKNDGDTVASTVTGPATGLGSVSLNFFFGNVRYTVPTGPVRVYVGGGVGGYKSTLNALSNSIAASFGFFANGTSDSVTLAYQGRAGVEFSASHVKVDAGYRFVRGNDLLFIGTAFGDLRPNGVKMHNLEANVRFGF